MVPFDIITVVGYTVIVVYNYCLGAIFGFYELGNDDMSRYPSCFPDDFETNILPVGVHFEEKFVYRVMKKGIIDREGFISTYEEIKRGLIPPNDKLNNLQDPQLYSTSCNEKLANVKYTLKVLSGHHPSAIIVKGTIQPAWGPLQLTAERTGKGGTHVDCWVYDDSQPQDYFGEVNDYEA